MPAIIFLLASSEVPHSPEIFFFTEEWKTCFGSLISLLFPLNKILPEPWFSIHGGRMLSPAGSFTSPLPFYSYRSCSRMERKGMVNLFSFLLV